MKTSLSKLTASQRTESFGTSIFTEISALAHEYNAVNLGQGFPDFDGPIEIKRIAMEAIASGRNQYAAMSGENGLKKAIARHSSRFYQHDIDPSSQITVMSGATEALFSTILAFINPGDEVIVFEPCYDSYVPAISIAGGIPVPVTLHEPLYRFNPVELKAAFSEKTKAIIINTPHNPSGTVFNRSELGFISDLCNEFDVLAIVDEVYEHLVFDNHIHIQLRSMPDMENRTITISSIGKTFSFTGWKLGWAISSEALQKPIRNVHQFNVFSSITPMQYAAAAALDLPDEYYSQLVQDYRKKRDYLSSILSHAGLYPIVSEGTYFMMADTVDFPFAHTNDFAKWLIKTCGIACIPPGSFYLRPERASTYVRFCFCKKYSTLETAAERFLTIKNYI